MSALIGYFTDTGNAAVKAGNDMDQFGVHAQSVKQAYDTTLKQTATKESVTQINEEINRLEVLQSHFEHVDIIDMPNQELQSYDQLNTKLSYYNDLLNHATTDLRNAPQWSP